MLLTKNNSWQKAGSLDFFECSNIRGEEGFRCRADVVTGTCSSGFKGPLCALCDEGRSGAQCAVCGAMVASWAFVLMLFAAYCLMIGFSVARALAKEVGSTPFPLALRRALRLHVLHIGHPPPNVAHYPSPSPELEPWGMPFWGPSWQGLPQVQAEKPKPVTATKCAHRHRDEDGRQFWANPPLAGLLTCPLGGLC